MQLPIIFQSLDRIDGREGRSKLLHSDSKLYSVLHSVKQKISEQYTVGSDRMDLHIELTKNRRDPEFSAKAKSIQDEIIDLSDSSNWGYMGRAFVLSTPAVDGYGKTHITISFFGRNPRPEESVLVDFVQSCLTATV